MRLLIAAVLALLTLLSCSPAHASSAEPATTTTRPNPVILIGTGGLTWSDVSAQTTPALWSFLRDGSSATLTIRSVDTNTCPIDGWLGQSAGQRAAAPKTGHTSKPPCPAVPTPQDGHVPEWASYVKAADALKLDARLGTLGDEVARSRQCLQAVGPGAAVAAARSDGTVSRYAGFDPASLNSTLAACPVTIVDVGSLRDPHDVDQADQQKVTASASRQIRSIDERIQRVLQAAPDRSDVIMASLSDAGRTERLRLVAAKGPHYSPGILESTSTKQPGLVQAQDLTVTLLAQTGIPVPKFLSGAVLHRVPPESNSAALAGQRQQTLVDYDEASHEVHSLVAPFFVGFIVLQLLIYGLAALVWKRRPGSSHDRQRLLRTVHTVAVVAGCVPVSTFLANLLPWWRFSIPMLAILASVGVFAAAIAGLALLGPWGRAPMGPLAVVSVVTMVVLALDVMTGSRLQLSSLMGLQPVVGGRFYGMGNVTFSIFATATLLLCVALSHRPVLAGRRRAAALVVLLVGVLAVLVDGAPFWGADGGGPPALLPGVLYFVLMLLGSQITWRRAVLLVLVVPALFVLASFLDWLRPPASRSHLGQFFQSILDGGASDIVIRKLEQNLSILFTNWQLTMLVPLSLAFVVYLLASPSAWGGRSLHRAFDRAPTLRPGLIAFLITMIIGFAVNDSGTAIPAVALALVGPLVIAVTVRSVEGETPRWR